GAFDEASGVPVNNIATWDPATGAWGALGAGVNGMVRALAVLPQGDLVAGGTFTIAGGEVAHKVARWDGEQWRPLGTGLPDGQGGGWGFPDHGVYAFALAPGGDLIAGGNFYLKPGDASSRHLARWDGGAWRPIGAPIDQQLYGPAQTLMFVDGGD